MQQHNAIKARYPDAILLFRVGDFYETFGQDAVTTSTVLGITLTKRNNGDANSSQLAGFPHHALDTYLHKLVKAGYRVAICDQLEDPKLAKGIVKRGVTELVTPGVATSDKLLEHNSNNFLAAIHFAGPDAGGGRDENKTGIAFLDISTGEFFIAEGDKEYADKLLQSLKPAEVIFQRNRQKYFKEYFGKIAALLSQVIGGSQAGRGTAPTLAPGLTAATVQTGAAAGQGAAGGSLAGAPGATTTLGAASLPNAPAAASPGVVATGTGEALGLGAASTIKIIADRDNNALLIMANGAEYEKIEEAIKRLDVVPRQVLIEVTIAEVTLNGALSYGLEWFFSGSNGLTGSLFNSDRNTRALPSTPDGAVTPQLPFSAVWRGAGGNIRAVLSALASTTQVNVLSSPHIMVTDNQVAKINVGSSIPVQGQSTLTGATAATAITTSVIYVDTGVVLSVRPHINSGGLVTMEISQEVSDVQVGVTTTGLNSPTINKRSAQTTVAVQSGDTMVLGGLIKDDKNNGSSGLPILSDLPVVGALFGTKTQNNARREMIITITPRVVNDFQQARDATAEFRKKLTGMRKLNPEAVGLAKDVDVNANPFEAEKTQGR